MMKNEFNVTVDTEKDANVEELKLLMSMYHSSDEKLRKEACGKLYEKAEDFMWHFLKKEFPTFYSDASIREDLKASLNLAFMESIDKFNPENGTLSTWLTYPFRHAVTEYINRILANSTTYHAKHMTVVEDAIKKLQGQGKPVSAAAIAYETGMSVKKVESTLKRLEANKIQSYESNEELENMMTSHIPSPEEAYLEAEARKTIAEALSILPEKDMWAVIYHFGLDGEEPRSYSSVAKLIGVSAPQVQTAIARSLRILKGNSTLKVMFAKGAQTYRQKQLDSIEISLVTNENIASAYDCLDEDVVDISVKKDANDKVKVLLTF